jgi:hypothetical protein
MKNRIIYFSLLISFLFTSCIKDKNLKTYTLRRPVYSLKKSVIDAAKIGEPQSLNNPGSFVLYNNTMYVNEKEKGIHVIDYSNPSAPQNKGFIPVPGNLGLSIKNNYLYADCFGDLMVFKIITKENIELQNVVQGVFNNRMASAAAKNTQYIETTWIEKDTTVNVDSYSGEYYDGRLYSMQSDTKLSSAPPTTNSGGNVSVGSSMAIFTIVNDFLYTVDQSNLFAFSLQNAAKPELKSQQLVSWQDVETIFPFQNKLFLGGRSGMYIFYIDDPARPTYKSIFSHVRVCDPVVADEKYAYVTLRNGSACGGFTNQLDVVNIENIGAPVLLKSFPFSNPHGLSKDGNILFICDGDSGLKVLDASDPSNIQTKHSLAIGKALDVIAHHGIAFVMLSNSIKLYSYDTQFNIIPLGSITKN